MPEYPLSPSWSAPITVEAGDIIQNQDSNPILITAQDPDLDNGRLLLPPLGGALLAETQITIYARCFSGSSSIHVVSGF